MKKITCMILSILMMLSSTMSVFADEKSNAITEEYKTIPVQYSDKTDQTEYLDVMIKDEHVYVNARKLAERFGYQLNDSHDEYVSVYNKENQNLPYGITRFYYNDTKVEHMLFTEMYDNYNAPFASVKNDKGIWIPLEYSLLILNSGMMIADNTILIDMPEKSIMDIYMDVLKNNDKYMFGWEKDFGYSDSYQEVMGTISHNINFLNGVITSDGDTWLQMLQTTACSKECALDAKYGEKISMLLCTESDKELKAVTSDVKKCMDLLDSRGKVGKILSKYSESLDNDVENLYKQCDAILSDMKKGNSDAAKYNRSYQALQKALDKQTWFSESSGKILEVQKGVTEALPYLEVGLKVAEVVKYADEFENQDKFTVEALTNYLNSSTSRSISSESVIKSMKSYTKDLQSNIFQYSAKRVFDENIMGWLQKGSKECVGDLIGTQANIELMAWSLASNYVPFISNGLEASEDYQLAMYSSIFQADTFMNYQRERNGLFNGEEQITANNLYRVSQYCYLYLKSCYITRDAALGSLKGKTNLTKEKIKPMIDYQNEINKEIAGMLVKLKEVDLENEKLVYGLLPKDNSDILKNTDEKIYKYISEKKEVKKVVLEMNQDKNGLEQGIFKGVDDNNNVVWEYKTRKYEMMQYDTIDIIGKYENRYYFVEYGKIIAIDVQRGIKLWENEDFYGLGTHSDIGDDGTIYICGYNSPNFCAVDKNGKTLKMIEHFNENTWWAYEVKYQKDKVLVELEHGNELLQRRTCTVNLKDFTYDLSFELTDEEFEQIDGKWTYNSSGGWDVRFTKSKVNYYDRESGILEWSSYIKNCRKEDNMYIYYIENDKGQYEFRTSEGDENILEYYGSWDDKNFAEYYSGSSSLYRIE